MAIARERHQVKSYPTPLPVDLIFYELVDSTLPRNADGQWEPGQPHWDPERYPHHELVLVKQSSGRAGFDGEQEWWYAAKRENQDEYNYEVLGGEQVVRTYIIKREDYLQNPLPSDSDSIIDPDTEFYYPPAGEESPDILFPAYCFADDTQKRGDPELDSLYVVIQRRFIRPVTVDYVYDNNFKRNVRITKRVIPATTEAPAPSEPGSNVEIQDGNFFHSVEITKELVVDPDGSDPPYPYELPEIPATQDYRFPSKLESVDLVGAWAWASAADRRDSYAEDYYFKFKITDPRPGPYSATVRRWITDDPEAIKDTNPVTIVPQPIRESIAVTAAWFYASSVHGNSTSAVAKEWSVPPTIHESITVNLGGTASTTKAQDRTYTTTLAATPNVGDFLALTEAVIDYRVREMDLGLYEVSVVTIDITGLYT
jgi:hypothetical protein